MTLRSPAPAPWAISFGSGLCVRHPPMLALAVRIRVPLVRRRLPGQSQRRLQPGWTSAQDLLKVLHDAQDACSTSRGGRRDSDDAASTAVVFGMDAVEFVIALLPTVFVIVVCIVAFARRRHGSPLVVNPYTLAIEPNADNHGSPPVVRPMPELTRSDPLQPGQRCTRL